mgnify:CR=1 FL=1
MQCWGCCYSKIKIIGIKLSLWLFLVSDNIVKNVNPAKKSVNNCPSNWFPSSVANNHCKTRTKWDSRFYSFFYDCCFLIFHYFQSPFFSIYYKYKNQLMNNQEGFFVCLWVVLFFKNIFFQLLTHIFVKSNKNRCIFWVSLWTFTTKPHWVL